MASSQSLDLFAMHRRLLAPLIADAQDKYAKRFGGAARWVVAAPGRVNLIGEHIDYNGGYVLPMAIDRYTVIAAGPAAGDQATVVSDAVADEALISLAEPRRHAIAGHWSNYVTGVVAGFRERGALLSGFQAAIGSDVPVGGGLSSSAALEVATATLLEAISGDALEPVAKALLCQQAEHQFAGVPCGIMDQFASVMCRADHLMLLDCRSRSTEQIPFSNPAITVLIVNSNVKHELADGEYAERRGQCEAAAGTLGVASLRDATLEKLESSRSRMAPVTLKRARHAIGEIARTVEASQAIRGSDWPHVGKLMYASHDSLRDDYEVSCRELNVLVDAAREIGPAGGVIGSRMTGGGFGGCTVSLVETAKAEQAAGRIADAYRRAVGIEPTILTSRPSRGAHVVG
jgi:galactokinase